MAQVQSIAHSVFHQFSQQPFLTHVRSRLDQWQVSCVRRGDRPKRALSTLQQLNSISSPRVASAYLRTICNGWQTGHRFQQQVQCRFGCPCGEDRLQHYAVCPVAAAWYEDTAKLRRSPADRACEFFLILGRDSCMPECSLIPGRSREEVLRDRGAALYALYRCHNFARHRRFAGELGGAFSQLFREALAAQAA